MTITDKIAFLKQYQGELKRERICCEQIEMLQARATKITPLLTDMPSGGIVAGSETIPIAVEQIVDAKQKLAETVQAAQEARLLVVEAIGTLSNENQKMVLMQRYILGKRWERIACDMGIGYHRVWEIHKAALKKVRIG